MEDYVIHLYREEYLTIPEIVSMTHLSEKYVRWILGYPPEV